MIVLPTPTGPWRMTTRRVDEAHGGEVTDDGGGDVRVVGEVELFDRGGVLEAGVADPADERRRRRAG